MGNKTIERHYWCGGCLNYRPVSSRNNDKPCCPDGHQLDIEQHIDWTFPYVAASENRI